METTISPPVSSREIKEEEVAAWANKEALPVLRELRNFANIEQVVAANTTSAGDGEWAILWASAPIPTGVAVRVIADVIGLADGEEVTYRLVAFFRNNDGTLAQVGATEILWSFESVAGADARFQISGQTITVEVRDDGASPFVWHAMVQAFATPRP